MQVIYSIGAGFAQGGIGNTAYHAVSGLHRHGVLRRLLCGSYRPTEIPNERIRALGLPSRVARKLASMDPTGWLWYAEAILFDRWATLRLERATLYHVWGNYGVSSLVRARELGMVTTVERPSTHPLYQERILVEEAARWGLHWSTPQPHLQRGVDELASADYVLIPSDFSRASFLAEGFPAERLLQLSFGVDTTRFSPAVGRKDGPFCVLFVGQVGFRKGVLYLLDAWRKLNWRDAELWLAGRVDPQIAPLLRAYEDLPGVRWGGFVRDPVEMYRQADLFVFPSVEEGSALVTYEALASGLPVVTTPNAGSVMRDGLEGFLVPVREVDALAERMERLRADDRLRCEMGHAARVRAEDFTWEKYGDRVAETFWRVVGCAGVE